MISKISPHLCFLALAIIFQASILQSTFLFHKSPLGCILNKHPSGCQHKPEPYLCAPGLIKTHVNGRMICKNPCEVDNGGCGPYATCSLCQQSRIVICTCKTGYTNVGNQNKVVCIDTCAINNGNCGANADCLHDRDTNKVWCKCKPGYRNALMDNGFDCRDVCEIYNGGCGANADCSHAHGSDQVQCKCKVGFTDVGTNGKVECKDSCQVNNGGCGEHALCSHCGKTNDVVCTCKVGYKNVGRDNEVVCEAVANKIHFPKKKHSRPVRPVIFDPVHDHHLTFQKDGYLSGVIHVKLCRASLFIKKSSRGVSVCSHIQHLLENYLAKQGISGKFAVEFLKAEGYGEFMKFHYKVRCNKQNYQVLSRGLNTCCQQKSLAEKFTEVKKPDSSESDSESNED